MDAEADPPPRHALRCPADRGHTQLAVREGWYFCRHCKRTRDGHDGRYEVVVDLRSGDPIPHSVFRAAWGTDVYDSGA